MIDLIDLTSPTYKEELAVTDKILATDGNNVFMVSPSGTDSETVDTMQKGIMAFDSEGKKGKLNILGFLSDMYGIDAGMSYSFFTKNPYSGLDINDIVAAMVEKGYIPVPLSFDNFTASLNDKVVNVVADIKDNDSFLISAYNVSQFWDFCEVYIDVDGITEVVHPDASGDYNIDSFVISEIGENTTRVSFDIMSKEDPWKGSPTSVTCIVKFLMDRSVEIKEDIIK
jgi:hypothetical protein